MGRARLVENSDEDRQCWLIRYLVRKNLTLRKLYREMHAKIINKEEFSPAWEKLVNWCKEKEMEMDDRPVYDIYLNNPEKHPNGLHILDICLSVK